LAKNNGRPGPDGATLIDAKTYVWATFCFLPTPPFAVPLIGHELGPLAITGTPGNALRSASIKVSFA